MERWSAGASVLSYVLTSLAMTSLTKYAASVWRFPGSSVLLLIECWATVAFLAQAGKSGKHKPWERTVLRHLPLVTLTKAINMYLSFVAMTRTSIPVYNVLKRLQPVYAMAQDFAVRGVVASRGEQAGVVLMCIGTIVTGSGDLDFDLIGYGVALAAAACQSLYLVLARHAQDNVPGLTHVDLLFYTACYNSVIFLPLSGLEAADVLAFLSVEGEPRRFVVFLVPYVAMGVALNYTTFWCTSANSPLATAVAGTAKGVLSTLVGILTFGSGLTPLGWLGLLLSTLGGLVYSIAQATRKTKNAA